MIRTRIFCARCRAMVSETMGFVRMPDLGLCDSCREALQDAFSKIRDLSLDSQKKIAAEYGVSDAEEAYVIRWHGRPKMETQTVCDWCGRKIASPSGTYRNYNPACGYDTDHHRCSSCQSKYEATCRQDEDAERLKVKELFG